MYKEMDRSSMHYLSTIKTYIIMELSRTNKPKCLLTAHWQIASANYISSNRYWLPEERHKESCSFSPCDFSFRHDSSPWLDYWGIWDSFDFFLGHIITSSTSLVCQGWMFGSSSSVAIIYKTRLLPSPLWWVKSGCLAHAAVLLFFTGHNYLLAPLWFLRDIITSSTSLVSQGWMIGSSSTVVIFKGHNYL